jgi:hypothetical protein
MNGKEIVETAMSFVGQKEIAGNKGFRDKKFQGLMEEVGWNKGQAWCVYFCEMVWKQAYEMDRSFVSKLDRLFNAGAVKTYNNFKSDGNFVVDKIPKPGCIVIWQTWKDNQPHWTGHAGIVRCLLSGNEIETIEGNTNAQGGREGIEVAVKHRKVNFDARTGLVLRGFIHPVEL